MIFCAQLYLVPAAKNLLLALIASPFINVSSASFFFCIWPVIMSQYMKLQNMVVGRVFQLWLFFDHKDKLIQAKKWTAPVSELLFEKLRDN